MAFIINYSDMIFPFLGYDIAPNIAYIAETCVLFSKLCKLIYCKHCGQILKTYDIRQTINGRASHINTCSWLDKMDPFRFFYCKINWHTAIVAGGWASFLHFNAHRNYINPWKKDGPIANMDLDVFFFNEKYTAGDLWYDLVMKFDNPSDLYVISKTKSPSVYLFNKGYDTPRNASAQFSIISKQKPNHYMKIDLLGEYVNKKSKMEILETFDQPFCRVGFSLYQNGQKNWILHATHTNQIVLPQRKNSNYKREMARRQKYIDRGYLNLECNCIEKKSYKRQRR